jgi:hypothetical protein
VSSGMPAAEINTLRSGTAVDIPRPRGWKNNDIHHIRPREYGGQNNFENLVPVNRTIHQKQFNPWWQKYEGG